MHIVPMTMDHYPQFAKLLQTTPGVVFRTADEYEQTRRYLGRNQGLSFIAMEGEEIIGMVMCGHDGRRGYLQHLLVLPEYREAGVGRSLVQSALHALAELGIHKSHLFVFTHNREAQRFWHRIGWEFREDIALYSITTSEDSNA